MAWAGEAAEIDVRDLAGAQQPGGPARVERNVEGPREVVSCAEREDAEHVVRPGQVAGHRADRAVTAGRDHQSGLAARCPEQLGEATDVLDLELLHHEDSSPVECAASAREPATAARVRACHQHGL